MSFKGQMIKLGFQFDGATLALWQSAARFAIGGGVIAGVKLSIGSSSNKVSMTAAANRALQIYTTQSIGTGTSMTAEINHTQTGASATIIEALRVNIDSEVQTGSWANAIVGRINYGDLGDAGGGLAAAVCGEMNLPAKSMTGTGGNYYCFDAEMNVPSGCTLQDSTTRFAAFIKVGAWGSGNFNDYGYFIHVDGLTAATDDLLSLTSHTLKVNLEGNERFALMGSQLQDGLGLGNSSTDMALGTTSTNKAIEIYTTSTATSGDVKPIYSRHTVGAAGATACRAEFYTRTEFRLGGYANALKGYMDFGTTGDHVGLASGVCAELRLPNKTNPTGAFFSLEVEMVLQTNSNIADNYGNMAGFMYLGVTHATGTNFDTKGRFMLIHGLTAAGSSILSAGSHTLKVTLNPSSNTLTERYLVLSTAENCLTLGDCTVGVNLTGSMTDGIIISGACGDNGIEISGTCTEAGIDIQGTQTAAGVLISGTAATAISVSGACTTGLSITAATGDAISITGTGFFKLGAQGASAIGEGIPVTSVANATHAMEVHTKPAIALSAHTSSFGIRSRYEVSTDQTNEPLTIHAIDGRLRVKSDLLGGVYTGVSGYLEVDSTVAWTGGTGFLCGGLFTIEMDNTMTLSSGNLLGVGINSAVHGSVVVSSVTFTGLAIWVGSSKEPWTYGITVDDCVTGIYVTADSAITTTGFSINGTLSTATSRAIKSVVSIADIATDDGYGVNEFDVTTTGTNAHHTATLSAWMSVNSTVGLEMMAIAQTNGIWEAGSGDVSDARVIFGMRAQASITNTPGRLCPWSLNTGTTTITALYDVGIPGGEIGWAAGLNEDSTALGSIPFMVSTSGTVYYIRIYDSADT